MSIADLIETLRRSGVSCVRVELDFAGPALQSARAPDTVRLDQAPGAVAPSDANAQAESPPNEQTADADEADADTQARELETAHL